MCVYVFLHVCYVILRILRHNGAVAEACMRWVLAHLVEAEELCGGGRLKLSEPCSPSAHAREPPVVQAPARCTASRALALLPLRRRPGPPAS